MINSSFGLRKVPLVTAGPCYFPEAVRVNEEVGPVNVSTWVLPSGITVGR